MKTMFKVSRTFQEFTPESIENGEPSETGFVFEDREMDFDSCVAELKDCSELSAYPVRSPADADGVWASTDLYYDDYSTGTQREESVHVDAPADVLFEMLKAAGLVK